MKIKYFNPADISNIEKPLKFTFPFSYTPHKLSILAMEYLQKYLENQQDFEHPFGLNPNEKKFAIGKMFGVLVVEDKNGKIGYLSAFSGKLAESNHISFFVPPIFDTLENNGFFLEESIVLNNLNSELETLENNIDYQNNQLLLEKFKADAQRELLEKSTQNKTRKENRKIKRIQLKNNLSEEEYSTKEKQLVKESLKDKHEYNVLKQKWNDKISHLSQVIDNHKNEIKKIKEIRKQKSSALQEKLFKNYNFLNAKKETKNLLNIFKEYAKTSPPAASGECCAPKLLQYAYTHNLKPISMAEFWWGESPKSEIRKHKQVYPACWGKCYPILSFMLQGLEVEENPLIKNMAENKPLEILFEDDYIIVVNKPTELLSVPGINIQDSVYERIKILYPNISGSVIVHRLDMQTSGLMIVAKDKDTHKSLQNQFIKRIVKKKYTALLNGEISTKKGFISLPLRVDLDDRPRQLVCHQFGKKAETKYEVVWKKDGKTLINFYPITGRTHQLRVHSAHKDGLNCPIVGDDLYGTASNRLYLHSSELSFFHPYTKEWITFTNEPSFSGY